jgi:hypothetical protein
MRSYNLGALKQIDFAIDNIPGGSSTTVDLSAGVIKFASYVRIGHCSLMSGGHAYGGQCGMQINIGSGPNVFTAWHHRIAGDPVVPTSLGITLVGS